MTTEFVSFDQDGVEREWIDPVLKVHETNDYFLVENVSHVYTVWKKDGWKYMERVLEDS